MHPWRLALGDRCRSKKERCTGWEFSAAGRAKRGEMLPER